MLLVHKMSTILKYGSIVNILCISTKLLLDKEFVILKLVIVSGINLLGQFELFFLHTSRAQF